MTAQPDRESFTPAGMPDDPALAALARLERIQAELEQDIARLVREIADQRAPDDRKDSVLRRVLATFGYGAP